MPPEWFSRLLPSRYGGFVLALGGGGSRGLAHLGVLAALEERNLHPDAIIGVSIGALFGAMYALNPDAAAVRKTALEFLQSDAMSSIQLPQLQQESDSSSFFDRWMALGRQSLLYMRAATDISLIEAELLITITAHLCSSHHFADAKIPFSCSAVSLPQGECTVFDSGNLIHSVAASMAIPGIFAPIEVAGTLYVDGGMASEIPALEARNRADDNQCVVAVNVGARPASAAMPSHMLGMLDWASLVKSYYLRRYDKEHAEVLIEPLVGDVQWDDFSHPEDEIARGYIAAQERLDQLGALLGRD
ncbi:MAG: patatin-like phospholipase family protein [Mariprofundales bacterium]|nr:patatin-like phospholipase family protein [Mariprofundales bacterium]